MFTTFATTYAFLKFNLIIVNILCTCNVEHDLSAAVNNFLD